MALAQAKFENIDDRTRRQAEKLNRELEAATGKRKVTIEVEGSMLSILRDLVSAIIRHADVAIIPLDPELSPEAAGKILGISRPLVVRRMEDGRLPFRYEGAHRRCKLEDVLKLKEIEDRKMEALRAHADTGDVDFQPPPRSNASDQGLDGLVLGTTNAPYRRAISAGELAACLKSGESGSWKVHVATFFTEVRPELVLKFAELHGISMGDMASAYTAMKAATGEANPALETAFERLAPTA